MRAWIRRPTVLAACVAVGFALLVLSGVATAASTAVNCASQNLQSAIDSAPSGATLVLSGYCLEKSGTASSDGYSVFTVSGKDLTLEAGANGAELVWYSDNGGNPGRILLVTGGAHVTLIGLTVDGGNTPGDGGSTEASGPAVYFDGGGAYVDSGSSLTVLDSMFTSDLAYGDVAVNHVVGAGGAIYNAGTLTVVNSRFQGNDDDGAGLGGAIANVSGATATVSSSTFFDNSGLAGGAVGNAGTMTVTNSTFSENDARGFQGGGGNCAAALPAGGAIDNSAGGTITVTSSTIAFNNSNCDDAVNYGGGIDNQTASAGAFKISASIVTDDRNNFAPSTGDPTNDCQGNFTSGGYNLLGQGCSSFATATDKVGVEPGFTAPTPVDNGGITAAGDAPNGGHSYAPSPPWTWVLPFSSPAIGAIPAAACHNYTSVDERDVPRPQGGACDIGAVELTKVTVPANGTATAASASARVSGSTAHVAISCAGLGACSGALEIVKHTAKAARGRYSLAAGATASVAVHLTAAGVALVGSHDGHLRVTLVIRPTDLAAHRQTLTLTRRG